MATNHIAGIHNYCDRWCERCFFTSRCAIYTKEGDKKEDDQDLRNKAFWERLSENFSKAKKMLEETAEKNGLDLNFLQDEIQQTQKRQDEIRAKCQNHPLSTLSTEYGELSRKWLDTQPGMIEKLTALKEQLELGSETQEEAKQQTSIIRDSLATIQWYSAFIQTKFLRALTGKFNDADDSHEQTDFNGSAKVGCLAVERSMKAWQELYELMPEQEDEFLKMLALLERLKVLAEKEFPQAIHFKRPGFDDDYIL
jgi:hypothetical protein